MKRPYGTSVKLVALFTASMLAADLFASPSSAESLTEALAAAYQSNPDLQGERAQLRATDEQVAQAVAGWRPTLQAQGSYSFVKTRTNLNSGLSLSDHARPQNGTLTLNQNVFAGGQTVNTTRQAKFAVEAGRETLESVEQNTLLNAVAAYMDVIRDESVVSLNRSNVQLLKRQLEQTQDRFRVGELTRTDVAQSEARLSGARTTLRQAEAQLTASRAAYERVVGQAPGTLVRPAPIETLPQSEADARDLAARNNPDLQAARNQEASSRAAIAAAKGALLPSFDLQAQYRGVRNPASAGGLSGITSGGGSSNRVNTTDQTQVLGVVTVPLYQSGAEYSRVRAAKEQASVAMMQIASVQRQVDESVRNAWEQLVAARATIVSSQEQVSANEIALEGVKQEEQVGSQTILDVLNADQELLNSRVTLVSAQRDEAVAEFVLLAATGQLTARQLNLPVKYYDPQENYEEVSGKWIGFGTAGDEE